jgi:tetratricopeptide (TPR) repeat protein
MLIWKRFILYLSCSAVVHSSSVSDGRASPQNDWQDLYQNGDHALFIGNYPLAERSFSEAIAAFKRSGDKSERIKFALVKVTRSYLLDNKLGSTEIWYQQLRKFLSPQSAASSNSQQKFLIDLDALADDFSRKGLRYNEPVYLQHSVELRKSCLDASDPKYQDALRLLGNAHIGRAEFEQAVPVLKELVDIESGGVLARARRQPLDFNWVLMTGFADERALACSYLATKRYSEAERTYKKLLADIGQRAQLKDMRADTCRSLATLYLEEKQYTKAKDQAEQALRYDDKRKPAGTFNPSGIDWYLLAMVALRTGNSESAEKLLLKSIKITVPSNNDYCAQLIPAHKGLEELYIKEHRLRDAEAVQAKINTTYRYGHQGLDPMYFGDKEDRLFLIFGLLPSKMHKTRSPTNVVDQHK